MNRAFPPHKKTTASATSSGEPDAAEGRFAAQRGEGLGGEIGVHLGVDDAGATQLTVTPEGPTSCASARVKPMTAALEAE